MIYLVAECIIVHFINDRKLNFFSHSYLRTLAAINADPVPCPVTTSAILDVQLRKTPFCCDGVSGRDVNRERY